MTSATTDNHVWTEKQLTFLRETDLGGMALYAAFRRRFRQHASDLTDQAIARQTAMPNVRIVDGRSGEKPCFRVVGTGADFTFASPLVAVLSHL
jgi:hypothetical protein